MYFNYTQYYYVNFIVPLFLIVFVGGMMFFGIVSIIVRTIRGCYPTKMQFILALLWFGIIAYAITMNVSTLMHAGWYLRKETESDTITTVGIVEEIAEPVELGDQKYTVNGKHVYGATFVIDGEKYYLMTDDGFLVGDMVLIRYLPNSHFVLYIEHAEP